MTKKRKKPFIPLSPSAWGQTPDQRLARLRLFVTLTKGHKGIAAKQRARYLEEIAEIEEQQNAKKSRP